MRFNTFLTTLCFITFMLTSQDGVQALVEGSGGGGILNGHKAMKQERQLTPGSSAQMIFPHERRQGNGGGRSPQGPGGGEKPGGGGSGNGGDSPRRKRETNNRQSKRANTGGTGFEKRRVGKDGQRVKEDGHTHNKDKGK